MCYVIVYILAVLGDKVSPSQNNIEKILLSVGIETDSEELKTVISELNKKSIDELIAEGRKKLSSMPVGGAAATPTSGTAAQVEEKKEGKKPAKEESESEDDDMGFGLFERFFILWSNNLVSGQYMLCSAAVV